MIVCADFAYTLEMARRVGGADLIVTSPPYMDARAYDTDCRWAMADYQRLGDAIFSGLSPGGTCLMVLDGPVRAWRPGMGTERSLIAARVLLDCADRVGFRVPDRLAYGRHGAVGEYLGRFRSDWEPLLWLERPGGAPFFDKRPLATPAKYGTFAGTTARIATRRGMASRACSGWAAERGMKHRGTLWAYGAVGRGNDDAALHETDHPARFVTRLAEDAVRCFCPPDGLVVDPFVGSGTSAVAAARYGRRFLGGDVSPRWAAVALRRLRAEDSGIGQRDHGPAAERQMALFDAR